MDAQLWLWGIRRRQRISTTQGRGRHTASVLAGTAELEPDGLYLTHLFREVDVILQSDWFNRRVRIGVDLKKLAVFRPATVDLILTKMARADEDDLQDIQFLIRAESLTGEQLKAAFDRARVPDVPEIQELFSRACPKVLALV